MTLPTDTFTQRQAAVDAADSAQGLVDAVEALAQLADKRTVPTLLQVLGFNNPGAAVAAVEGLIAIGTPAVTPLLTQLDTDNYGTRAWAIRALAGIGDPRGQSRLLEAATTDFAMSVRRAAARGLGNLSWGTLSPQERYEYWQRSRQALLKTAQDDEWVVRYATVVGLEGLVQVGDIPATDRQQVCQQLASIAQEASQPAVQIRARWALQRLSPP
ncbi:MAG: HEAT repeat domain-containing protein [Cyanobacteria bacterium J06628_6]